MGPKVNVAVSDGFNCLALALKQSKRLYTMYISARIGGRLRMECDGASNM